MLLKLPALPQIPGADRVVEPSGPQFGPVVGNIDTAGSVCVALELPEMHKTHEDKVRRAFFHRLKKKRHECIQSCDLTIILVIVYSNTKIFQLPT